MTTITIENLVKEFYKEYESKNRKFLLFDLANANENANTKVMKQLLQFNNGQYLKSFLSRLTLPSPKNSANITDQKKAIGPKQTGFIDLYIQYDDVHVVIENKIYGAGDTDKQLSRYIATVNGVKAEDFDTWYDNPGLSVNNTYVVYLTADGTKEPSENSLPERLKGLVNFYAINYKDDILPWLEEDVLPNIPYADDGMMIAGVRQYIAFLKQILTAESSEVIDAFVKGLKCTDKEKYSLLLSAVGENNRTVPENVLKSLRKQLEACAEEIYSGDVDGDWILHFTPSFVLLYKKSWAALDSRKYSIPSLYLYAGSTQAFLKNGCPSKLSLAVDHLSPSVKNNYPQIQNLFGNHDKNIGITLLDKPDNIKCTDVNNPEARKEFYRKIIAEVQDKVDKIDQIVVAALQNSGNPITPEKILENVVRCMLP